MRAIKQLLWLLLSATLAGFGAAIGWTVGRLVIADLTDRLFRPALSNSTALGRELARSRLGIEDIGLWIQSLGSLAIALGLIWCAVDGLLPMALGAWKHYRNHPSK